MFNIVPLVIIVICLIVIINIVIKKFSALASLDVSSIQSEREAKFKERIMSNRLKRNYFKYYSRVIKIVRPIEEALSKFFKMLYRKLIEFKDGYNNESSMVLDTEARINKLLAEAEELIKSDNCDEAEKRYIEIISMDSKHIKTFRLLGQLYMEEKKYQEAEQTLAHVLKLIEREMNPDLGQKNGSNEEINRHLAETYFNLAEVSKGKNNLQEALSHINEALEMIPNSPRYLDTKLEISIINKDKNSALEAYDKLVEVNPENQKLAAFKEQIDEL